jgi:hypothetical protein
MQYIGVIIEYAFSFFSLGNSAYIQHQQLELRRQRADPHSMRRSGESRSVRMVSRLASSPSIA